jgi:hypothetical protein
MTQKFGYIRRVFLRFFHWVLDKPEFDSTHKINRSIFFVPLKAGYLRFPIPSIGIGGAVNLSQVLLEKFHMIANAPQGY